MMRRMCAAALAVLFAAMTSSAEAANLFSVKMTLAYPSAREVHVLGTFDTWVPMKSNAMVRRNGTWTATLRVPRGVYTYRFLVLGDSDAPGGRWITDPDNPLSVPNADGTRSSVLVVPKDLRADTAAVLGNLHRSLDAFTAQIGLLMSRGQYADANDLMTGLASITPPEWRIMHEEIAEKLKEVRSSGGPPPLEGPGLDGRTVRLSDLRGKFVLVDFWATWCGPCMQEFPNVKRIHDDFKDSGFTILGVSLDVDREKLTAFLSSNGVTWPQIFDGMSWQSPRVATWGVDGIPATFLLGPDGNLIAANLRGESLRWKLEELLR